MRSGWLVPVLALAACTSSPDPQATPGLWLETIESVSQLASPPLDLPDRANLICVDRSQRITLPYYRVKAGPDCYVDEHERGMRGDWTSRTVCHNRGFGDMTITANVSGDFIRSFRVRGEVRSSTADIVATVTGAYQGPCPKPGKP